MKNSRPVWKSVSVPFSDEYLSMTLVRVKGWCRMGVGQWGYVAEKWNVSPDPTTDRTKATAKITHWLAVRRETLYED